LCIKGLQSYSHVLCLIKIRIQDSDLYYEGSDKLIIIVEGLLVLHCSYPSLSDFVQVVGAEKAALLG